VLVVFVSADYLTGVIKAALERKLSSHIGAKGIAKKSPYLPINWAVQLG
jgi:phage-related holin